MIENQEELRTALDRNREHKKQIKALEAQKTELDGVPRDLNQQLEELRTHVRASGCFCSSL